MALSFRLDVLQAQVAGAAKMRRGQSLAGPA